MGTSNSKMPRVDNAAGDGANDDADAEGDVSMGVVDMRARGSSPPEFIGEVLSNMDNKCIKASLVYDSIGSRHVANVCAVED